MIPFGQCLTLWRKNRGLSQAALAEKAGVPQPNLSDMERGEREVSLRTLRALALALKIRPGILADGIGPESDKPLVLTRERLERVAEAVAYGQTLKDPTENQLAAQTAALMKGRLRAVGVKRQKRSMKVPTSTPGQMLGRAYRPEEIQSLIERVTEKAANWNDPSMEENK